MDYFNEAFDGFRPQSDDDAALKFALNAILMDDRLSELGRLLTDDDEIGAIEGVPGWVVERRDIGKGGFAPCYDHWPPTARFRAHVDPNAYKLDHEDCFVDAATIYRYTKRALEAYAKRNPSKADEARKAIPRICLSF